MRLGDRVGRLEASDGGPPCSACGFDGDWSRVPLEVSSEVSLDGPDEGPDECPECGRVLVIRVTGHFSGEARRARRG